MKVEKISDNKLKVVLTKQDLIDKDIDIHKLNPNSIESQDLFFDILQEIEFYYGFDMGNSQILLEGVSTSNGGMILTVTKTPPHTLDSKKVLHKIPNVSHNTHTPKLKVSKKENSSGTKELIYKFDNFDNFVDFVHRLKLLSVQYENSLYEYNHHYFLVLSYSMINTKDYKNLLLVLSDYASFSTNVGIKNKLSEYGTLLIEKNAIQKIKKAQKKA